MSPAPTTIAGAVLFTDLVGFTEYNHALGDSAAVRALDQQLQMATDAIAACDGGRVVKELGDGLMLWLPDAAQAVQAAREFLHRVDVARRDDRFPLSMRLGLHYGDVTTRRDDVVGHTVNVAARIVGLAGPGELLISEAALAAAGMASIDGFDPVGPATVKGVADPIWLYRAADRERA